MQSINFGIKITFAVCRVMPTRSISKDHFAYKRSSSREETVRRPNGTKEGKKSQIGQNKKESQKKMALRFSGCGGFFANTSRICGLRTWKITVRPFSTPLSLFSADPRPDGPVVYRGREG